MLPTRYIYTWKITLKFQIRISDTTHTPAFQHAKLVHVKTKIQLSSGARLLKVSLPWMHNGQWSGSMIVQACRVAMHDLHNMSTIVYACMRMKLQLSVVTTPLKCIPCCPQQLSILPGKEHWNPKSYRYRKSFCFSTRNIEWLWRAWGQSYSSGVRINCVSWLCSTNIHVCTYVHVLHAYMHVTLQE